MASQPDILLQKEYLELEKQIKAQGESYNLTLKDKEVLLKAISAGLVEQRKLVYDTTEEIHKEYALLQSVNEVLMEQAGTSKQLNEYANDSYMLSIREAEVTINTLAKEIKRLLVAQQLGEANEDLIEAKKKELQIALDAKELGQDELKASQEMEQSHGKLVGLLGLKVKFEETRIGKMAKQASLLKNNIKEQGKFRARIMETFSASNLVSSVFDKIFESTIGMVALFNNATAAFNKTTGAGGEYNEVIDRARLGSTRLGVGLSEATAAAGALYTGFSNFTVVSEEMQESLIRDVAILDELGMSSADVVKNMNLLVKAVGMTEQAALEMQTKLGEIDIGLSPGQMAKDMQAAIPVFVRFGKVVGERVFMQLEKQVKQTGLAMQDLLSIAGQFDTFEGAAQIAGRLNAVLGGNLLNSTELLLASEADRIKMLKNTIRLSGREWKNMGRLERQMIANIATQGDVTKASQIFQRQTAQQIAQQKDLEERTIATQNATKQLRMVMENFAIMVKPLAEALNTVLSAMLYIADEVPLLAGGIKWLIILWAGWKAILISAKIAAIVWGATTSKVILGSLGKIAAGFTTTSTSIAATVAATGSALAAGAKGWIAFGVAVALIGGGIWLAATGLSAFVGSFAGMDPLKILAVAASFWIFALAIQGVLAAFANPISALGLVGLAVFAGIFALIAFSITAVAKSMTGLATALSKLTSDHLDKLRVAMRDFGDVVDKIDTDKTINFKTNIDMIGAAIKRNMDVTRMTAFKNSIGAFTLSLSKLEPSNAKVFDDTAQSYTQVIEVINNANDSRLANAARIADALSAAAMNRAATAPPTTVNVAGGGAQNITIKVEMDGKVIGQKVLSIAATATAGRPAGIVAGRTG